MLIIHTYTHTHGPLTGRVQATGAGSGAQASEKHGYLLIQQPSKSKRWKVRWVAVADGHLSWLRKWSVCACLFPFTLVACEINGSYACTQKSEPVRAGKRLRLNTCQVREADGEMTTRPFCLEVQSADSRRPLLLKTDSREEQLDWLEVLRQHIHTALMTDLNMHSPRAVVPSPMQAVLQRNPLCADCRALNPEWASLRFGVPLCSECSNVHRSFGTHISRVKGLVYDRWEEEQLQVLLALGSARANEFFEAEVCLVFFLSSC